MNIIILVIERQPSVATPMSNADGVSKNVTPSAKIRPPVVIPRPDGVEPYELAPIDGLDTQATTERAASLEYSC